MSNQLVQQESPSRCHSRNGVVELTGQNIHVTIAMNELVLILMHRDENWSRYSISVNKEFDTVAYLVRKTFPRAKKIVMAKLNFQKHQIAVSRYGICNVYSGMFLFRNGQLATRPYYSFPALKDYVFSELENPIQQFHDNKELESLDIMTHLIVGYFDKEDMPEYDNFRRVAHNLKTNCQFYIRYGYFFNNETSTNMRPPNQPTIVFRSGNARSNDKQETFKGCVKNYDDLNLWAHKKCMVREITLDNFEELNQEHPLFFILFYNPSNYSCVKDFRNIVGRTLMDQKCYYSFVIADGIKFAPYLHEFGKSRKDLPIIMKNDCIFPNFKDIFTPGKLRTFATTDNCYGRRESMEKYVKLMKKRKPSSTSKC